MSHWANLLRRWFLVLAWMGVIFTASSDSGSSQHTSRIIGPILQWLYPQIAQKEQDAITFAVRKTAHVTEFAILAWLASRALRRSASDEGTSSLKFGTAAAAWSIATAYAASDELHQAFVPTRTGCWQDVAIDSTGAAFGLGLLWLWTVARTRVPKGVVKSE